MSVIQIPTVSRWKLCRLYHVTFENQTLRPSFRMIAKIQTKIEGVSILWAGRSYWTSRWKPTCSKEGALRKRSAMLSHLLVICLPRLGRLPVNIDLIYYGVNSIILKSYGTIWKSIFLRQAVLVKRSINRNHQSTIYLETGLNRSCFLLFRMIFNPHDDAILKYLLDDNQRIEPEWYMPIIPMILVNGADGIGTGWMTRIPNYNPREIVKVIFFHLKLCSEV